MKKFYAIIWIPLCVLTFSLSKGQEYQLSSPDKKIDVKIHVNNDITWSVSLKNKAVLDNSSLSLTIGKDNILGNNPKVIRKHLQRVIHVIHPVVPTKKSVINDNYSELTLDFKNNYSLIFRAYDQGVAYRFVTSLKDSVRIFDEEMNLNFAGNIISYFPQEDRMISHYERLYKKLDVASITDKQFASLPVFFKNQDGVNILFTEADLYDYPCMFLQGTDSNSLKAIYPKYVLEADPTERNGDRNEIIAKEADYIAKTSGTRNFPWRVFYIADNYASILENDLVYQLSSPLKLDKTDWIKPGKVAWDWWNANNIYGVDFNSGINTETYKYYIDFASEYGLDYIILDEGWSKTTTDVMEGNPDLDVKELIRYGKEKNVGVILWLLWKPLDQNTEQILDTYARWGAKGIKVDFMQRADQYMVNFYERIAREAAKRQLVVDYHGAFKPVGMRRAYPNILSHEGVKGLENSKWSRDVTPEHDVTIPFIRMMAGPMDFTPGAMDNAQENNFFPRFTRPMSQGTRCHQIAMYVVYESPLQMLCDNPSNYYHNKECAEFISKISTVWDTTIVLHAEIAEYIMLARRNGTKWYIGAMTNWTEREFDIDFSFLDSGDYTMEIMQDGINTNKIAIDYKRVNMDINDHATMNIKLAKGGGWAAIITKK